MIQSVVLPIDDVRALHHALSPLVESGELTEPSIILSYEILNVALERNAEAVSLELDDAENLLLGIMIYLDEDNPPSKLTVDAANKLSQTIAAERCKSAV